MSLEMKKSCEKCDVGITDMGAAFICSYECTYCKDCSEKMDFTCPTCKGQLVARPTRKAKAA